MMMIMDPLVVVRLMIADHETKIDLIKVLTEELAKAGYAAFKVNQELSKERCVDHDSLVNATLWSQIVQGYRDYPDTLLKGVICYFDCYPVELQCMENTLCIEDLSLDKEFQTAIKNVEHLAEVKDRRYFANVSQMFVYCEGSELNERQKRLESLLAHDYRTNDNQYVTKTLPAKAAPPYEVLAQIANCLTGANPDKNSSASQVWDRFANGCWSDELYFENLQSLASID